MPKINNLKWLPFHIIFFSSTCFSQVGSPQLSLDRGFYKKAFDLHIFVTDENAQILYTTDTSDPKSSVKAVKSSGPSTTLTIDPAASINRAPTPCLILRTIALYPGNIYSQEVVSTYIFSEHVKEQEDISNMHGWPEVFRNIATPKDVSKQWIDYEMAKEITESSLYENIMDSVLLSIPSISLVTELTNLFGNQGIYTNASMHGEDWERPVSVELIDPKDQEEFQIHAGLRIRGGWSRRNDNPKHAFRLFFREEYGASKLEFPMFGNEGVNSFDKLDLRTAMNYSWSFQGWKFNDNIMNREVFSRDTQGEMGQPYTRSRYYHLYLNGMYWGLYQSQERSEARYAESYFGGDKSDYDVIKVVGWGLPDDHTNMATDGNMEAYKRLWEASLKGFVKNEDYYRIQGQNPDGSGNEDYERLLDPVNLIDYMLINYFTGNEDGPVTPNETKVNNYYAIFNRKNPDGFKFFCHDSEHTLTVEILERDMTFSTQVGNSFNVFNPRFLHQKLMSNPDYRQLVEDRIYLHFFNGGILTPARCIERFSERASEIEMAIIGESARWGDAKLPESRNKHNDWTPRINAIIDEYFPQRTGIVLDQFRVRDWYSDNIPPECYVEDKLIIENLIHSKDEVDLCIKNQGDLFPNFYFTLDGKDPRNPGGTISDNARHGIEYANVKITKNSRISIRSEKNGVWSPLKQLDIVFFQEYTHLLVSEINYHPWGGIAGDSIFEGKEFEFIEFYNSGGDTISLCDLSIKSGIHYEFDCGTYLAPGQYLCLASNKIAFASRYGFNPYDIYRGSLSNSGEKIIFVDPAGDTVKILSYKDTYPWPEEADGEGYSLEYRYLEGNTDQNDPLNWTISPSPYGNPVAYIHTGNNDRPGFSTDASIFPNPVEELFYLNISQKDPGSIIVDVIDLNGRRLGSLYEAFLIPGRNNIQLSLSDLKLPTGVYFLKVQTGESIQILRMVKI